MRLDLNSRAAIAALDKVKDKHSVSEWKQMEHILEKEYNCKVVYEDQYGISGYMDMPDDKYTTMFLIEFGDLK